MSFNKMEEELEEMETFDELNEKLQEELKCPSKSKVRELLEQMLDIVK